jgi:hypothetical protein
MFTLRDILFGLVLPAAVSAAVILAGRLIAWMNRRRSSGGVPGGLAGASRAGSILSDCFEPLAIGLGVAAGFAGLLGVPPFPAVDSTDWCFALALVLAVSGFVDARWQLPEWGRLLSFLVGAALTILLLAWPVVRNAESPAYALASLAVIVLVVSISWVGVERVSGTARGWPAVETLIAFGLVAITLLMSGSKKIGQVGGMLASTIVPLVAVALFTRHNSLGRATTAPVMLLATGLLLCGKSFASLTTTSVVLLWAGIVAVPVSRLPVLSRLNVWKQLAIGVAAVLALAGSAAGLAAVEFVRSMFEYGY